MAASHEFVIPAEAAGDRLDVFLARRLPDWSRSQIQRLIREGHVTLDEKQVQKSGEEIKVGARVGIILHSAPQSTRAEELPLDVIYEDSDILVVDKMAGMVMHLGSGIMSGTLVNALLAKLGGGGQLATGGGSNRPGIVHRLDKMTSEIGRAHV